MADTRRTRRGGLDGHGTAGVSRGRTGCRVTAEEGEEMGCWESGRESEARCVDRREVRRGGKGTETPAEKGKARSRFIGKALGELYGSHRGHLITLGTMGCNNNNKYLIFTQLHSHISVIPMTFTSSNGKYWPLYYHLPDQRQTVTLRPRVKL